MKKHFSKKILSIFLAALLVVTSVPTFAITAFADSKSKLIAEYFTTNDYTYDAVTKTADALTVKGGTVSSATDGTATFSEAYMQINNSSLFKDVNATTGLTFAFTYSVADSGTYHRHVISLGKNEFTGTSSSADHFYISGNQSWMSSGCNLFTGYVTSAGAESINSYPSGSAGFESNAVHECYVVLTGTEITYYIDGTKYSQAFYGSNNNDNLQLALNEISGYAYNYIGVSRWADGGFSGTIKDLRIYSSALTEDEVLNTSDGEESGGSTGGDIDIDTTGYVASTVQTGYFKHANSHDPSIVDAYEITCTDGSVYNFPTDYLSKNKKGYTSWADVASALGKTFSETKMVYYIFGTHFDNEKSYDLKNWTVVSDLGSITMFGTQADGSVLKYGSTGVNAATLRANYPEFDLMCSYAKYADGEGDIWAADMVFNYAMDCWTYYASASSGQQTETIFFATSQRLDGNFIFGLDPDDHTDCFVLVGGFAVADWANHPFLNGSSCDAVFQSGKYFGYTQKFLDQYGKPQWDNTSTTAYPGYIDPTVFYDNEGKLWLVYGSHANGIFCLPLDESTGIADFATTWANTNSYTNNKNNGPTKYDVYSGVKIVNSDTSVNGEGAFVVYDDSLGVYVLTVTYGNLDVSQGYTMKTFTSTSPDGPYYDAAGNIATSDTTSTTHTLNDLTVGSKQMGDYSFNCNDYSYSSPGHNSMVYTDTDGDGVKELFNVYHARYIGLSYYNIGGGNVTSGVEGVGADPSSGNAYYFNDFIHRAYVVPTSESISVGTYGTNPQLATVTMPYEYSGEQMTDLLPSELQGSYKVINHGNTVSTSVVNDSQSIVINTDGSVSGDYSGTWTNLGKKVNGKTFSYDIYKLTLVQGTTGSTVTYYGVFMKQYDESAVFRAQQVANGDKTNYIVTFSIMGTDNTAIWGSKKPAPAATDTNNSPYSQLSISPQIYTYGGTGKTNDNAGLDMFGTAIYRGQYCDNDYTTYLYISKSFDVDSITELGTSEDATPANLALLKDTSYSNSELDRYIVFGNVSSDYNSGEDSIMLSVTYHDADGTEYEETLYSFVMQTPVPAHEYGSAYNGGTSKNRECAYLLSAIGSYGSVTTNVGDSTAKDKNINYGDKDSSQIINPALCTKATLYSSNNTYYYNSVCHAADIPSGLYATGSSETIYATQNALYTPVRASYYYDLSDLEHGTNAPSTVNGDGTYTLKAGLNAITRFQNGSDFYNDGVYLYNADGYTSNSSSKTTSNAFTMNTDAVGAIGSNVNVYSTDSFLASLNYTNNNGANWFYITLTGDFNNGDEEAVLYTNFRHAPSTTRALVCDIKYDVNVYDKSYVRDALDSSTVDENGNHLVAANYTAETWTAYQNTLKAAYDYCNNYKQVPDNIDNDGDGLDDTEEQIAGDITTAYENLLSIDEYNQACELYAKIIGLINTSSQYEKYTTDSVDALRQFIEDNQQYAGYVQYSTNDPTASDFWRIISASSKNYDTDASSSSKADYDAAIEAMQAAIDSLRLHVDDTDLNTIIDNSPTTIEDSLGNQYYTYSKYQDLATDLVTAKSVSQVYNDDLSYANVPMYEDGYEGNTEYYTSQQVLVNDETQKISDDIQALLVAATDTSPYDALVELVKYQDLGAFVDGYFDSDASIIGIIKNNGSQTGSVTYDYGVSADKSQKCDTQGYTYGMDSTVYVVDDADTVWINTSQEGINVTTTELLTEINTANSLDESTVLNSYNVTLNVNHNHGEVNYPELNNSIYKYGQQLTYTPANPCYKWEIAVTTADGTNTVEIPGSASYTFNIHGDTVITCYTSSDATVGNVKVQIQNIYGIVDNEFFVPESNTITLSSNSYQFGDSTPMPVDVVPFYTFAGWRVNGETMKNGTYNLADLKDENGVVVLRQRYKSSATAFYITLDKGEPILAEYDTVVELKAPDDAYAIAYVDGSDYYVVTYGDKYSFYAIDTAEFVTITKSDSTYYANGVEITDSETIRKLDSKLPFVSAIGKIGTASKADTDTDRYYSFTAFSAPSLNPSVTITEYGTIYALYDDDWDKDTFVIGGSSNGNKAYTVQAKNPDELAQQYFLKINNINTNSKVVARPYVKYTFTVDGTTIQTIEYGNIVSANIDSNN